MVLLNSLMMFKCTELSVGSVHSGSEFSCTLPHTPFMLKQMQNCQISDTVSCCTSEIICVALSRCMVSPYTYIYIYLLQLGLCPVAMFTKTEGSVYKNGNMLREAYQGMQMFANT